MNWEHHHAKRVTEMNREAEERKVSKEEKAIRAMNAAAGLANGFDDSGRRLGISFGYIGNCSMRPGGYDDRSWGFFRPHPDASQRMIGSYANPEHAIEAFYSRRGHYLKWAEGAIA